ncbi:MAG: sporulation initiation factor Spo0A C-terminal domain-containing protein [Clostridia bacterium]|nr:sporulation initiation factor Spo0A C-terminal domain-containing protein [Clostridia bacterium]
MKKSPVRTYIAAMDYLRLENWLGALGDFWIIGSGDAGETVLRELYALEPDLLILEGNLSGLDGFKLLEILGATMPAPPRTLYLGRAEWLDKALQTGADCAACENADNDALSSALQKAMEPTPRLAKKWEEERLRIAEELLNELSIPDTLKGKAYMRYSCGALACAPSLAQSFSSRLYPITAREFHTTPQAVERAIRTAVEYTWLHGDLNAIQRLFGMTVDADRGKPTNAEFLSLLAEHVKSRIGKSMRGTI